MKKLLLVLVFTAAVDASPGAPYAGGGIFASAAWSVVSASFLQSKSVTAQDTVPSGMFFRADGLKMYIAGDTNNTIFEYDLSVAWNVTTAAFLQSKSVAVQDTSPSGVFFRADGLKMYVMGGSADSVHEYDLSVAWSVISATFLQSKSIVAQDSVAQGLFFRSDGLKMYIVGSNTDTVYEYNLSVAWDVSSASFLQSKLVSAQDSSPIGLFFKPDGLKMYVTGATSDRVNEYDLSVAWDLTTASFLQFKSVTAQDTNPLETYFRNSDGLKMYVAGSATPTIFEYDLGP